MRQLLLAAAVLVAMVCPSPQNAQNPPRSPDAKGESNFGVVIPSTRFRTPRQILAVNLLRAINTAEAQFRANHGSFAAWDTLVEAKELTDEGMNWAARNDPELADVHLSPGPEILPGWKLRLHLSSGGTQYDAMLEDTTVKVCGYAAFTDERGVIRQGLTIDCDI
jgi:hypothetical protein